MYLILLPTSKIPIWVTQMNLQVQCTGIWRAFTCTAHPRSFAGIQHPKCLLDWTTFTWVGNYKTFSKCLRLPDTEHEKEIAVETLCRLLEDLSTSLRKKCAMLECVPILHLQIILGELLGSSKVCTVLLFLITLLQCQRSLVLSC